MAIRFSKKARAVVAAGVVAGCVAGGSVALATAGSSGPEPQVPSGAADIHAYGADAPAPNVAQGVDPAIYKQFGIFRRQGKSSDLVAGESFAQARGANAGLARLALQRADGDKVFLLPSDGGICITSGGHLEEGCISNKDALAGDNAQSIVCAPGLPRDEVEFYGVLPDSATDPQIKFDDGSNKPLAVENNTFVVDTPRSGPLPVSIAFTLGGAKQTVTTNVPSDASSEHCA